MPYSNKLHSDRKLAGALRAEDKLHSVSKSFISQVIIPQVIFLAYLHSEGTQHRNLHPAGWPILFCGPTQELVLATANTGKTGRSFEKNAGEWTGRLEMSKEEIPGSKCSMYGYIILTYSKVWACEGRRERSCVAQSLRCVNCNFTTPLFKLIEEVHKPGPGCNAAVQNIDLSAAVTTTSIDFKKLRLLLAALDLSPPSDSGLHEISQTVCDQIAELASDDLREKLIHASGPNRKVNISAGTRYNTCRIRTSRRTGLLTATQATTLAIETKSGKNYIVSAFTRNKMCQKGALLRGKGDKTTTCPGWHVGCSANIDRYESLSEYQSE